MDPVSHVIFGRALVAACDTRERTRFGSGSAAAAVLGALAPDADCVLMPAGWDIYLRFHEVATHSLLGAAVMGCGAAAVVRVAVRRASWPSLARAGALAAVSHLALDAMSGARLGLLWPLTETRFPLPVMAMAEPWLIAILAVGAVSLWFARRRFVQVARGVVAAVAVYAVMKGALLFGAHRAADATSPSMTRHQLFEARWGSWTRWTVYEREGSELRAWDVNGWSGTRTLQFSWPAAPVADESPLVARSRQLPSVVNFLRVHDLGFAIERAGRDDRVVLWSDIRYCWQQSDGDAPSCGLWFGGSFTRDGRPLMQVVLVGGWTQTRRISP